MADVWHSVARYRAVASAATIVMALVMPVRPVAMHVVMMMEIRGAVVAGMILRLLLLILVGLALLLGMSQ